jgi:hypothetical protein
MNTSLHPASLVECLAEVTDPRLDRCRRHKLIDLLVIAVCAMLCGAEGFIEMEEFGLSRREWLAGFLELPSGIPSPDTFGRVFALLDPSEFARAFARWIESVRQKLIGEVIPIDGKKVRRSSDTAAGHEMIELVSAWASRATVDARTSESQGRPQGDQSGARVVADVRLSGLPCDR